MNDDGLLLAEIRGLRDDLRRLFEVIAAAIGGNQGSHRHQSVGDDERDGLMRMARAINASVGLRIFSCVEIIEHTDVDPILRAALAQVIGEFDSRAPRRLGKKLARAAQVHLGTVRVERIGKVRDGALWRVSTSARLSQSRTVASVRDGAVPSVSNDDYESGPTRPGV